VFEIIYGVSLMPLPQPLILIFLMAFSPMSFGKLPEVNEQEASQCRFLGEITASSGYGKNPNWQSIARTYVEKKAEGLGATHLGTIQYKAGGSFNGDAKTKAYTCP
jgi:hypothetical protein